MAILLPVYVLTLGLGKWEVRLISTATLIAWTLATLAVGQWGHRFPQRRLLLVAAWLMAATGLLLAGLGGIGAFCAATGSLATVIPQVLTDAGLAQLDALRLMFVAYGLTGVAIFVLYRALPDHHVHEQAAPYSPLSRLVACGLLKIAYDVAFWRAFRKYEEPSS